MELVKLNKWQMTYIYITRMREDFPRSERKPLKMILRGMKEGIYECLGVKNGKSILGYAILVCHGKDYLFDYLATSKKCRNKGVGAEFLALLKEHYKEAESIIGEVENPDLATNEEERNLQERRYQFYLRNGLVDTGVLVKLFGVDFRILELVIKEPHDKDTVKELYKNHYKIMLPEELYLEKVKVIEE